MKAKFEIGVYGQTLIKLHIFLHIFLLWNFLFSFVSWQCLQFFETLLIQYVNYSGFFLQMISVAYIHLIERYLEFRCALIGISTELNSDMNINIGGWSFVSK